MSPAAKYWSATIGGVAIFAIAVFVFSTSAKDSDVHWGAWAAAGAGWAVYYFFAPWIGRCPACGEKLYRDAIFSDIAPTCPACGRDRYAVEAEGDRA